MPTLAIAVTLYGVSDLPNPWTRPSAKLVNPQLLHLPVNPVTNTSPRNESKTAAERKTSEDCMRNMLAIDKALHAAGAHFLAASGTSAFGVMPGGGMHLELSMLEKFAGLTPREALASATSNYADAYGWARRFTGKAVGAYKIALYLVQQSLGEWSLALAFAAFFFAARALDETQP